MPIRSICLAGKYMNRAATLTSDRTCATCVTGHFKPASGNGACSPWAKCDYSAQYQSVAPTSTNDRECSALTMCTLNVEPHGAGQWTSVRKSRTRNNVCSPLDMCDYQNEFESVAPTLTSDRACTPLTVCAVDHYETRAKTLVADRACTRHTACTETQFETQRATGHRDRACAAHATCAHPEWERRYEGTHHDRVCEIRAPCRHVTCKLVGGKVLVSHTKKEITQAGNSHHACKFDRASSTCNCMCHNEAIDHEFAYLPTQRFFWKKTTAQVPVAVGGCAAAQYSPAGAAVPGALSLCRERSLGQQVRIADGGVFAPLASNANAQGSAVVVIANDRISWVGEGTVCPGFSASAPRDVGEVVVYECVKETCPHPLCCDCGNEICTKGRAEGACRVHAAPKSLFVAPTTTTTTAAPVATAAPTSPMLRVDINAANPMELAHIYGIGPALAVRIADYRGEHGPFASVADLNVVAGVGPITVQRMVAHAGGKHAMPMVGAAVTATAAAVTATAAAASP